MAKTYAYCRVSTSDKAAKQQFERQKYILEHSGIAFDKIYEEHVSGGVKGSQRVAFSKMLDELQEGDTVCITETSRFGRNYIDCLEMIDLITQEKKAVIKFLSNGLELKGGEKMNPYEWLTISQFFIMDEFQKRQIGYNTKNTLAKKREQGIVGGRRKSDNYDEQVQIIKESISQGLSAEETCEKAGCSRAKFYNIKKELNKAVQ